MALSLDAEAVAVHQRSVGRSAARFVSAVTEQNEAIRGRGEVRLETRDLVIGEEADGIAPGAPDAWALAYGRDPIGRPEVLAGPNAEVEVWAVAVDADDRDAQARTLWLFKRHARSSAAAAPTALTVAGAAYAILDHALRNSTFCRVAANGVAVVCIGCCRGAVVRGHAATFPAHPSHQPIWKKQRKQMPGQGLGKGLALGARQRLIQEASRRVPVELS